MALPVVIFLFFYSESGFYRKLYHITIIFFKGEIWTTYEHFLSFLKVNLQMGPNGILFDLQSTSKNHTYHCCKKCCFFAFLAYFIIPKNPKSLICPLHLLDCHVIQSFSRVGLILLMIMDNQDKGTHQMDIHFVIFFPFLELQKKHFFWTFLTKKNNSLDPLY